jgi:hypothetical protein
MREDRDMDTTGYEPESACGCPPAMTVGCHGAETPEQWEWIERMGRLPAGPETS